ncbi:TIGR00730 family Rossman fold protein [Aliidiomarina sedimenti]|uniref:Cytokinin riboside 5'-monophosphate phosphoribohydrolase n=1 Tax=Aliidiomarina sedimenti TaxID=1933879 RepID=A0ABY0C3A2_9GAMM|nr:TIGR00730 family Rossman fold protein [Aliidiomarina sedimenti]RUO32240.1 TIGR00730 family Rossman fold protein [Aliidiomarina sedimenti]
MTVKAMPTPEFLKLAETASDEDIDRAQRLAHEWLLVEDALDQADIRHTIPIFGSARIPAPDTISDYDLKERRCQNLSHYYAEAREVARRLGQLIEQRQLTHTKLVTGGGPGVMEAANRGAHDVGHQSIGLNIVLPREQHVNPFIAAKHSFEFQYFAMRKMHFLKRAKAIIVFPGGFGTMDELFETLTLIQTKKMPRVPILLYGKDFWQKVMNLDVMAEHGLIDPADIELYHPVDSVEECWQLVAPIIETLAQTHE